MARVVHHLTGEFDVSFRRWRVGLGLEEQLADLRRAVDLEPLYEDAQRCAKFTRFLDYQALVRPRVCADTRLLPPHAPVSPTLGAPSLGEPLWSSPGGEPKDREQPHHPEDFFFRTIHLGTECWGYIAIQRLKVAIFSLFLSSNLTSC